VSLGEVIEDPVFGEGRDRCMGVVVVGDVRGYQVFSSCLSQEICPWHTGDATLSVFDLMSAREVDEDGSLDERRHGRVVNDDTRPQAREAAIADAAADGWVVLLSLLLVGMVVKGGRVDGELEAVLVLDGPQCVAVLEQLEPTAVTEVDVAAHHLELSQHTRGGQIRRLVWKLVQIGRSEPHGQLAVAALRRQSNRLPHLLPAARLRHTHGRQQVSHTHLLIVEHQQLHCLPVGRPSQPRLCAERMAQPLPQLSRSEEAPEPSACSPQPQYVIEAEKVEAAAADEDVCEGVLLLMMICVLHHTWDEWMDQICREEADGSEREDSRAELMSGSKRDAEMSIR